MEPIGTMSTSHGEVGGVKDVKLTRNTLSILPLTTQSTGESTGVCLVNRGSK